MSYLPMSRAGESGSEGRGPPRVLVAGVSTRALAESAVRAGYTVLSVDAFGDMDNPAAPALSLTRELGVAYSARAAARASRELECEAVCYLSDLENHPRSVELLSRGRTLWGNPPSVLARARDPLLLSRLLRARLQPAARVRASAVPPPSPHHSSFSSTAASSSTARSGHHGTEPPIEWLAKPRASGGGHGITEWRPGASLPRSHLLQERIAGVPGSIAFVADGRSAVPFALSRQLVGDPAFGASGFQYCGSILCGGRGAATELASHGAELASLLETAAASARVLTEAFALVGVNCLDFVARSGVPHAIELNPRYSASMELAERAFGLSVFHAHARACGSGKIGRSELPRFDLARSLRSSAAIGKAILFAPQTMVMADTRPLLRDPDVRDVPHPGETIPRGHPVCTIFATGRDDAECYSELVRKARGVYEGISE